PFSNSFTSSPTLTPNNPNLTPQFNSLGTSNLNTSAVLTHLASSGLAQNAANPASIPPPQSMGLQPQYYPTQQQQSQLNIEHKLSSSWGASSSPRLSTASSTEIKKRAESESYVSGHEPVAVLENSS